jgi:hypothetical protein
MFRVGPIYRLADTNISVSANGISVSAISVSVSVSANLDNGYIGIGQISAKIHGYRPKYWQISGKSQLSAKYRPKGKYWYRYR